MRTRIILTLSCGLSVLCAAPAAAQENGAKNAPTFTAEQLTERAAAGSNRDRAWARLRMISATSVVLWLSALLAGTWLTAAA